jgi:hypothetical protein
MKMKRLTVAVVTGALVAAGAGAAIGATSGDGKKAEDAILSDAAKRLDVTPQKLRDALGAAEDAQLDQAVKDGALTQAQADAIKARRKQSGRVLGIPGFRGPDGPGGPGEHGEHGRGRPGGPGGGAFDDIAKALGITQDKLFTQLRAGKSLADIAKANGKTLDDVKAAVKTAVKAKIAQAVKDGDLTQAQADDMLAHLDEHLARLADLGKRGFRLRGGHGHDGAPPPP